MNSGRVLLGIAMWFAAASTYSAASAPKPENYPASIIPNIVPAKPQVVSKHAKLFKAKITEGAKLGPNFAGHYTVVRWGCGMDSFMFVVVDAITGKIYEPPEECITLAGQTDDDKPPPGFNNDNPSYSLNSKLLLTVGVKDSTVADPYGRALKIYLFDQNKFKLVYRAHARLNSNE